MPKAVQIKRFFQLTGDCRQVTMPDPKEMPAEGTPAFGFCNSFRHARLAGGLSDARARVHTVVTNAGVLVAVSRR